MKITFTIDIRGNGEKPFRLTADFGGLEWCAYDFRTISELEAYLEDFSRRTLTRSSIKRWEADETDTGRNTKYYVVPGGKPNHAVRVSKSRYYYWKMRLEEQDYFGPEEHRSMSKDGSYHRVIMPRG